MGERPWAARVVALALLAAEFAQYRFYMPRMPARMATHFGAMGRANGWMSRAENDVVHWGVVALAVFIGFVIPIVVRYVPIGLINVPNRDHWLAPERQAETLGALESRLAWFGAALLGLLLVVHREVFRANLRDPARLDEGVFVTAMAVFMGFVVVWLALLLWRFRRPQPNAPTR